MNVTFHESQYQSKSQWIDIIKQSGIDTDVPVYLVECRRPKQEVSYLSSWLQSELSAIPNEIIQQANAKEILIVFHIYEWVNVDLSECLKLIIPILNLNSIRIMVPCIPQPASNWVRYFPSYWVGYRNRIKDATNVKEVSLHKRNKKFTCLNGVPRPHRLYTVSKLLEAGLLDDGYVSLTKMSDYNWDGWDERICQFTSSQTLIDEVKQNVDIQKLKNILQPDDLTPKEQNNHSQIQTQFFNDAYWNIVTETFGHNVVDGFLTEKTFKPIANLQPFVIIGTYGSLCLLRELGFKTFGDYIDESYDDITDETHRLKAAVDVALDLARMSHSDHIALMTKVKPILEHNQQVFYSDEPLKELLNQVCFDK